MIDSNYMGKVYINEILWSVLIVVLIKIGQSQTFFCTKTIHIFHALNMYRHHIK